MFVSRSSPRPASRSALLTRTGLPLLFALFASACWSNVPASDATVIVHARDGDELGVATPLGVVFVGAGQRTGVVDYTVFFDDGPSLESAEIEALTTDLLALSPELKLNVASIAFPDLRSGDRVVVRGRDGREPWQRNAVVAENPRVDGLILRASDLDDLRTRHVGAGVYFETPDDFVLVGLVRGRVQAPVDGGGQREYISVAGPDQLLGLAVYGRSHVPRSAPNDRQDAVR